MNDGGIYLYNIEGVRWLLQQVSDFEGMCVCEFGNQHVWEHAMPRLGIEYPVARDWMLKQLHVAEYVSIDINGEDGALPLDLTKLLPSNSQGVLLNGFDIVTNIGTSEHCGNENAKQWMVFRNTVAVARVDGLILHQLPPAGRWLDHCDVWYRDGLGEVLANHFECELLVEEHINLPTLSPDVDYLCIALRRLCPHRISPRKPPADFVERLHR